MRKLYTSGFVLKILLLGVFYFWDVAMSTSGNISMDNKIVHSEHIQPISGSINNELSDFEEFEELETRIAFLLRKYNMKGASIAVAREGQLVFARGIGYADIEAKEKVKPEHMFRIASVSKLITAITIMKMKEFGLLDLDDRVFGKDGILNDSLYLDYKDRRAENITIRNLLNHSAGWNRRFGDHLFMSQIISRQMKVDLPVGSTDIIRFALSKRLHYNPGSGTSYSNLGYVILGEIIEKISGIPYEDYVRQVILSPLGIQDMRIGKNLEAERFNNEVKYYEQSNAFMVNSIYDIEELVPKSYGGNDIEVLGAAGGWIASPAELLKLIVAIDNRNDMPKILSDESIELMSNAGPSGNRTIGWSRSDRWGNYWRTGTFAGTSALVMRQNNGLAWSVLFNSSTYKGTSLASEINREVQAALNKIENWPDHNLFHYFASHPIIYHDGAELR